MTAATGWGFIDVFPRLIGIDPDAARARTEFFLWSQGAFVSLGMYYGAAGVNVAHELIHRSDKEWDKLVGRWLLAFTWDTGFAIEHVHGHHRNVGTELDPATARRGEYIVAFVYRSTVGQWLSAKKHEDDRLKRKGLPNNLFSNKFWRGQLMTLAILGLYVAFMGWWGIPAFILAGGIGKIYLEVVNYIEHYGLVRIPGTRVEARHSWDSHRRVSGGMFYNLMLHANHHKIATRRYWELEQSPPTEAAVLPSRLHGDDPVRLPRPPLLQLHQPAPRPLGPRPRQPRRGRLSQVQGALLRRPALALVPNLGTWYCWFVRIITKRALRDFWKLHPAAEIPLRTWHLVVAKAHWSGPADVKRQFGSAVDFVRTTE